MEHQQPRCELPTPVEQAIPDGLGADKGSQGVQRDAAGERVIHVVDVRPFAVQEPTAEPRKYEVVATNQLDDGFMASAAVSGNALFLRTRSHLYRID